jgi:hypothetical protein
MKRESSKTSINIDKEVKELKLLINEAQAKFAPGEEITPEIWNMLMRMRRNKYKQSGNELATTLSER